MKALLLLGLSLLVPSGLARAGDAVEVDLPLAVGEMNQHPSVSVPPGADRPAGVEPIGSATGLQWVQRPFGPDRKLLVAAHLLEEPVWIRVDANFDGDLNDDEPHYLTASGTTYSVTVEVEIVLDPGGDPTLLPLRFVHHHGPGSTCLHLTVPLVREGTVVLEGRVRRAALYDGDADLDFGGAADYLLLDVDGDTELDRNGDSRDRVPIGKPFRVGDRGYIARVETSGRLVLTVAEGEPPPPARAWKNFGAVSAGAAATGESASLSELSREYDAATVKDGGAAATVYTERNKVVTRIGRVGTEEAFRFLSRLLDAESNPNLKAAVVRAMGYGQYVAHAGDLVALARNAATPGIRTAAIGALHGMGAPERGALYADLVREESDVSVFQNATRHLAYLRTPEAIALLAETATKHATEMFRYHAYDALTRYGGKAPDDDLVRAAACSGEPRYRALGLEHAFSLALPDARELARAALAVNDEAVVLAAVRILASVADPGDVEALLALPEPAPPVRALMLKLLEPVRREDTVAVLLAGLGAGPPGRRALVADVLAGIPLPSATRALASRLDAEKDPAVLAALMRALGRHDASAAVPKMVDAAERARKSPEALGAALDALARLGFRNKDVRRFFDKLARSGDPTERLLALDAAAKSGDPAAADLLIDSVTDKAWTVRLVAVQGLGKVRVKRAVPVLIERLGKEESARVRAAIAESLFLVTGQNYYDIVDLWKKWWEEQGETFSVPADVPRRPKDDHGGASAASFYGVPVESDRIIFVIDQSGSMSSPAGNMTKLERAVDETLNVVEKLDRGVRFNLILFETAIHPWQKQLVPLNPGTRGALTKYLRSKQPTGGTNLYDGLEMALLTKDVDTIYLLSDGAPGSGKWVQHADILREVGKINRTRKIAIHCIAVGFDSALMKDLAAENDGQYARR